MKKKEFVYFEEDSIPENLLCGICTNPLINPVEHNPIGNAGCSSIYCKKCAINQKKCPHCRNNVFWKSVEITPLSQLFLFKPLNDLKVICPICKGNYCRIELENHISKCPIGNLFPNGLKIVEKN